MRRTIGLGLAVTLVLAAYALRSTSPVPPGTTREKLISAKAEADAMQAATDEAVRPFLAKQFQELDALLDGWRARRELLPNGCSKLAHAYVKAFDVAHLGLVREWVAARPRSVAAHSVLCALLADQGWETHSKPLLDQALDEYRQAQRCDPGAIDPYLGAAGLAIAQGWTNAVFGEFIEKGLAIWPRERTLIHAVTHYLDPKMYGDAGDIEVFAGRLAGAQGPECYALAAIDALEDGAPADTFFKDTHFAWPKLKDGLVGLVMRHPTSPALVGYEARFAKMAGDGETARLAEELLR